MLRALSLNSVANKLIISRKGGLRLILSAIKEYDNNVDLLKEAIKAMRILTRDYAKTKIKYPGYDCIQVILDLVNKHYKIADSTGRFGVGYSNCKTSAQKKFSVKTVGQNQWTRSI